MTTGGPDLGSLLEKFVLYGASAPLVESLTNMLNEAFGLFGQGSPDDGAVSSQDVGAMQAAIHAGMAANAEQGASQSLTDSKQTLQAIDDQLGSLANQIVDDNDACKKKLLALKAEVDNEQNYLSTTSDSSVVQEAAVQKFLADKAGEASEVILTAMNQIAKRQQQITDVASQYSGAGGTGGAGGAGTDPGVAAAAPGGSYAGGYAPAASNWDPASGGGYGDGYYDDSGSSLGDLAGMLPQMASTLPGALGGLGGGAGMGNSLGDLSGLIGSAVRDATANNGHDKPGDAAEKSDAAKTEDAAKKDQPASETAEVSKTEDQKAEPAGATGPETKAEGGGPPPPPPTPAPTMVTRPDGTTATASSPAVAAAARAHLGGQDLVAAYKDANIALPQPGTPVKDTIPPSRLQMGDIAAFQDRYEMCEGDGKVYLDGQSQPLSALAKLPGFLGFFRPASPADAAAGAVAPAVSAATTVANTTLAH